VAQEKEDKARMVSLAGRQEVEQPQRLDARRENLRAERKRERKNHRRQGRNNSGELS
jgi:hypothetical protein